jgi:putative PIN family toxin of toxin-antitoxin system
MIKVVLDTNILVSALWTPAGNASIIVNLILSDKIVPCFDFFILDEYKTVLKRPRLSFSSNQVDDLLTELTGRGLFVTVQPSTIVIPDETDRKFYDVAKFFEAHLITGNARHYPEEPRIINPARFLEIFYKN